METAFQRLRGKSDQGEGWEGGGGQAEGTAHQIEQFVDGKFMTILMTLLTIFALWGDNLRLCAFSKDDDYIFYYILLFSLVMFFGEFVMNAIAKPGYKWGFFFVLDFVATVSLIPDIPWLTSLISSALNGSGGDSIGGGAGGLSSARTARVVRLVRLIRLIRIVKLYSMVSKAQEADQEEKLKAQARAALNAKQAALKRVEASRLGKVLSEWTTRRVIVGVLLILFVTPYLRIDTVDEGPYYGLSQLFWLGRSNCSDASNFGGGGGGAGGEMMGCEYQKSRVWVSEEGWKNYVWMYSMISWSQQNFPGDALYWTSPPPFRLLALRVPDPTRGGELTDIQKVEGTLGTWEADPDCQGLQVPSSCPYRSAELRTVYYAPFECVGIKDVAGSGDSSCLELTSMARFEIQSLSSRSAGWDMVSTLFVCVLLATMSSQFQNDTQRLVIAPLEKMVNIIKQLAEDPLKKPDVSEFDEGEGEGKKKKKGRKGGGKEAPQLETSMLETTIMKIGGLLQMGFGAAGAEVIGKNMSSGDGELSIMMPGKSMHAIFGFVGVKDIIRITQALQEDVTIFLNKVGRLVHSGSLRWGAVPNRCSGEGFLLLWKLFDGMPSDTVGSILGAKKSASQDQLSRKCADLANRSLFSFLKILAHTQREEDFTAFRGNEKLGKVFGEHASCFHVDVACSLHLGWAIEGPIGSDFKLDASYLSPHVVKTIRLFKLADSFYRVPLILSHPLYTLLSVRAKAVLRRLDFVKLITKKKAMNTGLGGASSVSYQPQALAEPEPLYSLLGRGKGQEKVPEEFPPCEILKPEQFADLPDDAFEREHAEYLFDVDMDIELIKEEPCEGFIAAYRSGLGYFLEGDWETAREFLEPLTHPPVDDFPSQLIVAEIEAYDGVPPRGWAGHRVIELDS